MTSGISTTMSKLINVRFQAVCGQHFLTPLIATMSLPIPVLYTRTESMVVSTQKLTMVSRQEKTKKEIANNPAQPFLVARGSRAFKASGNFHNIENTSSILSC